MDWIDVNKELPKDNTFIKVKSDNRWTGTGLFQDGKFVYSTIKGACYGEITHWIPDDSKSQVKGSDISISSEPKWIKCSERMPEEIVKVITYSPTDYDEFKVDYLLKIADENCWAHRLLNEKSQNVTHWMPLPKQPEE